MKQNYLIPLLFGLSALTAAGANPIPPDPAVRIGTLDNGLTYYIRQNATPAGQADFFIAQRVGSINETDSQQGLAHFLEHMCFNGTEHFPANSLISYLEGLGVKFGANLNAYTSTDETIYNISAVPTARQSAVDSCVMILSDWSGRLLLNDKDIDDERGVIRGEMRQRSTPGSRIMTAVAPKIYGDNIYGRRMPIGKAEIIDNFAPDTLRAYYHKWYHPENQAVIIVGDINPDSIEASLRRHFADIRRGVASVDASPVTVDDNALPIYAVGTDPEQANYSVQLHFKNPLLDASEAGTIEEVKRDYIRRLISSMLVDRLDAIETSPDCPWSNLGIGDRKFLLSSSRDALMLRATCSDDSAARQTLRILDTELLRAAIHGFTPSEFERAKLTDRAERERALANAAIENNTDLARRYAANFTRGEMIPSTEQFYKMMKGVERTLALEDVNQYFASVVNKDGANRVTVVYAPADTSITEATLATDAEDIDMSAIEPFVDPFADRPLMAELPEAGKIVGETEGGFGSTVWQLSNGINVLLRPSAEKPDEVIIHAISPGGLSMNYDAAQKGNYKLLDEALAGSAYGGHSSVELRKLLAGKNVKSSIKIGNTTEELQTVTSPTDLETALQLLYLRATSAGRDDNAFGALMATTRSKLSKTTATATNAMGDTIHSYVYRHHPLGDKLHLEDLAAVDYDSIIAIHRDRFGDMADFTYIITGNFDADSIRPLVERYIASLPAAGRKERAKDFGYGFAEGNSAYEFHHPMGDAPQSIAYTFWNAECPFNLTTNLSARTLGSILKSRLLAIVREEMGLTYSITGHCAVTTDFNGPDTPSRIMMPIYIKVAPGHEKEVYEVVDAQLADLIANGPTQEEVAKQRAYLLKNIDESRKENAYWDAVLKISTLYGQDMDSDYVKIVESMSPESLRDFAASYLTGADRIRLTMLPE